MHVAIVGGGLTGLVTALLLATKDHRVTLIEGQEALGGVARPVAFGGCTFSPGPQYVWGFGDGGPGRAILDEAGVSVPFLPMGEDFEHLSIGDAPFRPVRHPTPEEASTLEAALDRLGGAEPVIARGAGFRRSGAAMLRSVAMAGGLKLDDRLEVFLARDESVSDLAERYPTELQHLRRILYSQGIFAESLDDLSAVVFAAARRHLVRALHVPEGGVAGLISALIDATHAHPRISVTLACEVRASTSVPAGHRLATTGGDLGPFDRIVACCSPAVVSRITGRSLAFEPSHSMGVACLAVCLSEDATAALRGRNFTWYRSAHDVDFCTPSDPPACVNFVSPTLNGGATGDRHVICAYVPAARERSAPLRSTVPVRQTAALLARVTPGVEVVDATTIGPARWTSEFGAFEGAIYGRRLTAASLQRSALDGLPRGWSLAHSGAGIPGVLGCLQMAAAAAAEVSA